MAIIFRREEEKDYRAVEELVRESFWNVYRPGCMEHYVLKYLRHDPAFVPELDIVMEKDGELIGQNIFGLVRKGHFRRHNPPQNGVDKLVRVILFCLGDSNIDR